MLAMALFVVWSLYWIGDVGIEDTRYTSLHFFSPDVPLESLSH